MRQTRGGLALAAEDRVRRSRSRTAELLSRDRHHLAVDPSLAEDLAGEAGPRALALGGHVPDALRQLQQLPCRLREMSHEGRAADLVVDDANLVALAPELAHCLDEVPSAPAEEPRAAGDPAVPDLPL